MVSSCQLELAGRVALTELSSSCFMFAACVEECVVEEDVLEGESEGSFCKCTLHDNGLLHMSL